MIITYETLKDFCSRPIRKLHVSVTKTEFEAWRTEMKRRIEVAKTAKRSSFGVLKILPGYIPLSADQLAVPLFLSFSLAKFNDDKIQDY